MQFKPTSCRQVDVSTITDPYAYLATNMLLNMSGVRRMDAELKRDAGLRQPTVVDRKFPLTLTLIARKEPATNATPESETSFRLPFICKDPTPADTDAYLLMMKQAAALLVSGLPPGVYPRTFSVLVNHGECCLPACVISTPRHMWPAHEVMIAQAALAQGDMSKRAGIKRG